MRVISIAPRGVVSFWGQPLRRLPIVSRAKSAKRCNVLLAGAMAPRDDRDEAHRTTGNLCIARMGEN